MNAENETASPTMAVVIVTRFSVLSHVQRHSWGRYRKRYYQRLRKLLAGGRKLEPSIEEKRAYLFHPDRLEYRLWTLETFTLNSLANQSARDFRHIVLTSVELPKDARVHLERLSHSFGFEIWDVDLHTKIDRILEERLRDETSKVNFLATMRLDDDDALDREAVRTLRSLTPLALEDYIVTWPSGMYLLDHGGKRFGFERVTRRDPPSCGLTRIRRTSSDCQTIYSAGNHREVNGRFPVLSLPTSDAWLMTSHHDNVSTRSLGKGARELDTETRRVIAEKFGVTI